MTDDNDKTINEMNDSAVTIYTYIYIESVTQYTSIKVHEIDFI